MIYLAAFVALGLAATLLGPAIPLLRDLTGASEGEISILFVVPAPGYIIGSTLAGRLYDRGGGHRILAGGLVVMAAGALLLPFVITSLAGLAVSFAILGLGMSVVDVGCNTLLVWSRTGDVGSIMNALHLCFGIGALVGPLSVGLSQWWLGNLTLACIVLAVPALVVAALALRMPSPSPRRAGQRVAAPVDGVRRTSPRGAMALVAVFFAIYVGMELGFAGWISTFAEETGLGDAPIPALAAGAFWAGFTLCRVISVPVARRVPALHILTATCVASVVAAGALVVAGDIPAVVWIGTFLFGAAVAPQYPMMVALAEERIGLSGGATAVIVASSSIGGLALPWVIGQMLDSRGAEAMPQVITVAALVLLGWFVLLERRTRTH
jgi:FHS family Na+ dependent glucose MFS transporter 1